MSNLVAFGLGDAWQSSAGLVHSCNCASGKHDPFAKDAQRVKSDQKSDPIKNNQFATQLISALKINPLYFGPDTPSEPTNL
ncbi:MAG: hypothetical protein IT342_23575 [Candidatus Melainabacteria bacterium]|nr:hypothetical protein [Candidatus Melainabacteria bacterium]